MPLPTSKNGSDGPEVLAASGRTGLTASAAVPVREFQVGGMDCASCAVAIERAVRGLAGVRGVQVDVMRGTVRVAREVRYDDADLTRAIRGAGYSVREPTLEGIRRQPGRLAAAATSGLLLAVGLVLEWTGSPFLPCRSSRWRSSRAAGTWCEGLAALKNGPSTSTS